MVCVAAAVGSASTFSCLIPPRKAAPTMPSITISDIPPSQTATFASPEASGPRAATSGVRSRRASGSSRSRAMSSARSRRRRVAASASTAVGSAVGASRPTRRSQLQPPASAPMQEVATKNPYWSPTPESLNSRRLPSLMIGRSPTTPITSSTMNKSLAASTSPSSKSKIS